MGVGILEANDYFIMAIVFSIVFVGILMFSVQTIGALTPQQQTYYAVIDSLDISSLFLTIGFIVAGIVKRIVKRKAKE
jgi:hypothetical protein